MPVEVIFGNGVIREVTNHIPEDAEKVLVVTGRTSARRSGALEKITGALRREGKEFLVYDRVLPNPTLSSVYEGAEAAKSWGADCIVAVGGGSPMDAAKAMAALATNDIPPDDFFSATIHKRPLPLTAVPTTAGSGSEVTPYSVLVDDRNEIHAKRSVSHPLLFPCSALVDPELTVSLPPATTADTGMDALSHAMEGILCRKATPLTDAIAMEAVRLIFSHLPRAFSNPTDMEARAALSAAATMAGTVIAHTGTELVHGMGYNLTVHLGIPHGRANALLLPHVVRLYGNNPKTAWLVKNLGGKWVMHDHLASHLARQIEFLMEQVDIPPCVQASITPSRLEAFAESVMANERKLRNCHAYPTTEQVETIYAHVLGMA